MKKLDTRSVTELGLLVAVEIVLSRFCSINAWDLKIGFSFLPVAVAAMRLGPLEAAVVAAVSDFVGAVLFPIGAYFPGFTLSSFLTGMICGYFLRQRPLSFMQICIPFLMIFLIVDLGLNTLWLTILYHKAASLFFLSRLATNTFCLPVHIGLFYMVYRPLAIFLPRYHTK